MEKLGLVLSGGGAKGAYEIGVYKALKKLNKKIDIVTGTSIGAINGMFITQKDLKGALKLWKHISFKTIYDEEEFTAIEDDKLSKIYIEYAKKHNLNIYPIDINISTNRFTFKNNGLYLPLTLVSGIGEETAKAIQDERKKGLFTSFRNFKERIKLPRKLNENLVYVDAFNKLEKNKAKLISECDDETFLINKYLTGYIEKEIKEYEEEILEAKEKECLGFNLIYNPNRYFIIARKKYKGTFLIDLKETRNYKVWIKLKNIKESNTKLGHIMYQGIAYDETLEMRFVYFDPNIKIDLNTIYYAYVSYKTSDKYGSEIIINEIINKYKKEPN